MPAQSVWLTGMVIILLIAVAACNRESLVDDSSPDSTPVVTSEPDATPSPSPTTPPPTPVPSGSFLRIDGVSAQQVVLWDVELPAEYAATRYMLYQRSDARNWSRVGELPIEGRIIANPTNPEILFLGDHPPCLRDGEPIPFYRSLDGGENWERIPGAENIRPIMIWAEDPQIVVGSRCGLAISQDSGLTWNRHLPDSEFDLTRLTATQIGLFGVFTSQSDVSYLRQINIEDPDNPVFEEPILSFWGTGAVHATRERIFVGEASGVHFSDDGGRTWSFTREGLEDVVTSVDPLEEAIPDSELEAGLGIFAVIPHPENASRIFLGTVRGLYLSEDDGETWGKIPEIEDQEVRQLNFSMGGSILYVTTNEGVIVLHNP